MKYNSRGFTTYSLQAEGARERRSIIATVGGIIVDHQQNVFAAGNGYINGKESYFIAKFDSSKKLQWINSYKLNYFYDGNGQFLFSDKGNNVYLMNRINNDKAYHLTKYNSKGTIQWTVEEAFRKKGKLTDAAIDSLGNIYVTGLDGNNYRIEKFNNKGSKEWLTYFNEKSLDDMLPMLKLDASGDLYLAGTSTQKLGEEENYDYIMMKFKSSGDREWVVRYNGISDSTDIATAMAVDDSGSVYITGKSWIDKSFDIVTIGYDTKGTIIFIKKYDSKYHDAAVNMTLDKKDNIFILGESYGSDWRIFTTLKYSKQ